MPLTLTYHQIHENDGCEIVGYYDFIDSSFIEEEDAEIKELVRSEP